MINGFGLQKLGILALRVPVFASLLLIAITLTAGFGLTKLGFSGENVGILRDGSKEIENYDHLLKTFRNFNNDAIVLMKIDNLATVEGIETYRDLHFEFQLDERVESVLSVFSLVQYKGAVKGWTSALPAEFDDDAHVEQALKQLVAEIPSAQSLFSTGFDSAVMVVYVAEKAIADASVRDTMDAFNALAKEFETDTVKLTIAGQPALRSGLIRNIAQDLMFLAPLAMLLCALLALVLFKSPVAMVLCAFPSFLSLAWFLGGAGLAGIDLNFLTNILPVLLIVIIFADTLHLFIKWQKLHKDLPDGNSALIKAIEEIGPACAISSLTTAVALLSLCASGNFGLYELGIVGALGVMGGFISVIVALPLACHWAKHFGYSPKQSTTAKLENLAKPALKLLKHRQLTIIAGLLLCAAGLYAHWAIDSRFRLIDYLGTQSDVSQSESFIDERYFGSTPLFAIVKLNDEIPMLDPENERRVYSTLDSIEAVFSAGSYYSLVDFAEEVRKGGGELNVKDLDQLPRELTSRFISQNKSELLITVFSSANLSAAETRERMGKLTQQLEQREVAEHVRITGYPILSGVVAPRLMDNLRISLLIAVGLSIFIIAIAAGSLKLGLACLVPNLLPIICVELVLLALGIPLNMSITVALTVAFGIAVDDSIHMLNQFLLDRQSNNTEAAVESALSEVTPAIFSTTLILSGGLFVMMFSTLPAISVFSGVVIMTLIFAFLADIFQLPVYLSWLNWRPEGEDHH